MKITVRQVENVRFQVEARGHTVMCDQPVSNHGTDMGMTPPELLLSSLGTCAAYYAVEYLRGRHLPVRDVEVTVEAEKAKMPARLGSFAIRLQLGELEERHREGVMRAVKACLIHNTLLHAPEIGISIGAAAGTGMHVV